MAKARPYHHGNLRSALVDAAVAEITEVGPAAMSLRKVAARAGVTHAATTHHFHDKTGLLTAVAAEGHRRLAAATSAALGTGGLLDQGVAYLRFAHEHRPYFEVMFRPELTRATDPELVEAREASGALLLRGAQQHGTPDAPTNERAAKTATSDRIDKADVSDDVAVAAWALVHGIATLWLNGNLPARTIEEAEEQFRRVAKVSLGQPRRGR